jgi:hypothetical protein
MRIDLILDDIFDLVTDPFRIRKRREEKKFNAFLLRLEKLSNQFDDALRKGDTKECDRIMIRMKFERP